MQVYINDTEINNIASIGTITHMLNQTPSVSISVNDDGTLAESVAFGTTLWKNVQFQSIYILESTVYLFIGRVAKVEFTKDNNGFNLMILQCEGLSAKLNDVALSKNYIYSEGLVKTANYDSDPDKLLLTDLEGNAKTWDNDYFVNGRNVAVLLTDSTSGTFSKTWLANAAATKSADWTESNNYTYTNSRDGVQRGGGYGHSNSSYIDYQIGGTSFQDSYKIKSITIDFAFWGSNIYPCEGGSTTLQILKNGVYVDLIGTGGAIVSGPIILSGTDAELKQYLTSESSNYTHLHLRFKTQAVSWGSGGAFNADVDYLSVKVEYTTTAFTPIQKQITDNGASWIIADDANFYGNGVAGESAAGAKDGDKWQIGENSKTILSEFIGQTGLQYSIDAGLSYYLARSMIGLRPLDVVNDIVDLEDAYWMERYDTNGNCIITILLRTNFGASVYTITEYGTYIQEYPSNQYKSVRAWGNQTYTTSAIATDSDSSNTSPLEFALYREKINTQQDLQRLADSMLNRYKTMRPSLVIELKDITSLQVGMNVTFNSVVYPIRRIDYSKQYPNGHLRVKVYLGLGQSPPEETLARNIQKALRDAHEAKVDRINVSSSSGIPILSYTNLIDKPTSMTPTSHGNEKHSATYQVDNLETAALDTSTTKYPCNNVVKAAMDLKAPLDSPTFTTLLKLANNVPIKWRNALNSADLEGLRLDNYNNLLLGLEVTTVQSKVAHYFDGYTYHQGIAYFTNNNSIKWKNAAGDTDLEVMKVDTNNVLKIGSSCSDLVLDATNNYSKGSLTINTNNVSALRQINAAASAYKELVKLDSSDILQIGADATSINVNSKVVAGVANGSATNDAVNKSQLDTKLDASALDTSTNLDGASASDSKVPSQLAVKTYVDGNLYSSMMMGILGWAQYVDTVQGIYYYVSANDSDARIGANIATTQTGTFRVAVKTSISTNTTVSYKLTVLVNGSKPTGFDAADWDIATTTTPTWFIYTTTNLSITKDDAVSIILIKDTAHAGHEIHIHDFKLVRQ